MNKFLSQHRTLFIWYSCVIKKKRFNIKYIKLLIHVNLHYIFTLQTNLCCYYKEFSQTFMLYIYFGNESFIFKQSL